MFQSTQKLLTTFYKASSVNKKLKKVIIISLITCSFATLYKLSSIYPLWIQSRKNSWQIDYTNYKHLYNKATKFLKYFKNNYDPNQQKSSEYYELFYKKIFVFADPLAKQPVFQNKQIVLYEKKVRYKFYIFEFGIYILKQELDEQGNLYEIETKIKFSICSIPFFKNQSLKIIHSNEKAKSLAEYFKTNKIKSRWRVELENRVRMAIDPTYVEGKGGFMEFLVANLQVIPILIKEQEKINKKREEDKQKEKQK